MRVFASIVTVAGLVAVASADLNNACPSSALLNARGGGFFDKLDAKISSMTKSSNDVMDKATKSIDKASSKAQNGIDQADAKLKKVQADTEAKAKKLQAEAKVVLKKK